MVKIQKSGNCYFMYLPNEWINNNKLDKGSNVEIQTNTNNIIVSPEETEKPVKKVIIKLDKANPEIIKKFIISSFKTGCDEFIIQTSLNNEELSNISKLVKNLGLNIIELNKDGFKIKSNTSIDDLPLFCWEYIYKIINIIRMQITNEKKELIKEQIKSLYYNKLTIQRTIYRYQQSLVKQRIKQFEANIYSVLAINLNELAQELINVKDKKYLEQLLAYMERFLNVFNHTDLKPLCELIEETNKLKKDKIYKIINGLVNALTEYYVANQ